MSFADHLDANRNADGTYDLTDVEDDYAAELRNNPEALEELILKAAKADRRAWESHNRSELRKQWDQPVLSPELDLEKKVPLGDDVVIEYGSMDHQRIQIRKDMVTLIFLAHSDSFNAEIRHWLNTQAILPPDSTIGDAIQ